MECLHNANGDIRSYAGLGFFCGSTEVRGQCHIGHAEEWIFFRFQRFMGPYIDTGTGYFAALQGICQGIDIYYRTPGSIDDAYAIFHLFDFFFADHPPCFIGQWGVKSNVVRFLEKRIQIHQFNTQLLAPFQGNIGIIADGSHVECLKPFGYV